MRERFRLPKVLLTALAAASLAACAPKASVRSGPGSGGPEGGADGELDMPETIELSADSEDSVEEAALRGSAFAEDPDLGLIHFPLDVYTLDADAREVLKENAEYLIAHPGVEALVEGHCDDLGTLEYNLSLGQRRAKSVRDFYQAAGVPGSALATISYGEEMPVCAEDSESCRSRNRRSITKVRLGARR